MLQYDDMAIFKLDWSINKDTSIMQYENVDTQTIQIFSQLLFLQKQLVNNPPKDILCGPFVGALTDFINVLGDEIHKQAL